MLIYVKSISTYFSHTANELDLLLSKIFTSVRKQNGAEYELGSLSGSQRSFQRQ